ncbi:MAG: rhodanese-like domain-containing protein [Phycisphaerales bacterium]
MLKTTFVIALIGLVLTLVGCQNTVSDAKIVYMDVAKAKERLSKESARKDIAVLDARSKAEYDAGHIPGAVYMTPAALPVAEGKTGSGEVVLVDKDLILIYGSDAGSQLPRAMAKRLLLLSYDDVYVLQGGMREWVRLGGTVSNAAGQ